MMSQVTEIPAKAYRVSAHKYGNAQVTRLILETILDVSYNYKVEKCLEMWLVRGTRKEVRECSNVLGSIFLFVFGPKPGRVWRIEFGSQEIKYSLKFQNAGRKEV